VATYTVLYTVTIAREVEADGIPRALDVALDPPAVERLLETEWDRQDIRRVEVIAEGDTFFGPGHGRRMAVNL
jgi:hypothetical protein